MKSDNTCYFFVESLKKKSEMNYKIISSRLDSKSYHLYYLKDECLYKKNGMRKGIQYYTCTGKNAIDESKCPATGKVIDQKFQRINCLVKHNHESHKLDAEAEKVKHLIKLEVRASTTPIATIFRNVTKK